MKPAHDPAARKRAVNLTLNEDLVRQVKSRSGNLSAVVESLLARHLAADEAQRRSRLELSRAAASQWNEFASRHGSVADEYSPF